MIVLFYIFILYSIYYILVFGSIWFPAMDAPDIKIIGEYIIDKRKKIGHGGYSEVYQCEKNSKKLAAKIMEISPD